MIRWSVTELEEVDENISTIIDMLKTGKIQYEMLDVWTSCKLLFLIGCQNTDTEIAKALNINNMQKIHRNEKMIFIEI